eukprot:CAMPEP_0197449946 /NCGR_PEP_ID=MMETSP1175-20131217/23463_1 /TAXON_ID=1003142 /ORGANISM="Triceratium dubium, Strain CCMP147" /LENGTH=57 /DNA_ID=CAMNT_0042982233 /DNA_START=30 /DNA_END=203 /DNA_ORIENTATION=-
MAFSTGASEDDDDSAFGGEQESSEGSKEPGETSEDMRRSMFLLGLTEESGNTTRDGD